MDDFKGKQFNKDVIILSVGYYLRFNLSYRDIKEILSERGISVSHTTIQRWVKEYSQLIYYRWKKTLFNSSTRWNMDETYIEVKGKWHYLYRAIDDEGMTLDISLRRKRDKMSAYSFLKRLINRFGEPKVIVTDKAPSTLSAFKKLKREGRCDSTIHCRTKYLNNLIEQDHRLIKRRCRTYKNMSSARSTIKGMEVIYDLYKKSRRFGIISEFSSIKEINILLDIKN